MRSICLNFEINKPALDFSIENINSEDVIKFNTKLAQELVDKYYSKINAIIGEIISEFGSLVKFSFNISASTIFYYQEFAPSFLNDISKLDYRCISFNKYVSQIDGYSSLSKLTKELDLHEKNISETFNIKTSEIICLGKHINQNTIKNISNSGIKAIISNKTIDNISVNQIININDNFDVKLLQTDEYFSDLFVDNKISMTKIISNLNNTPDTLQFINLNLNYSDFIDNEQLFTKLRNFPEKVMSMSNFTFNSVDEIVKYAEVSQMEDQIIFPKTIFDILNENDVYRTNKKSFLKITQLISSYNSEDYIWNEVNSIDLYTNYENGFYSKPYIKQYLKIYRNTKVSTLIGRKYFALEAIINTYLEQDFLNTSHHKFTDLATMPKVKLKKLLSLVDAETIFYSIQNQSNILKDKVLSNISLKALANIEDLMETPVSDISNIEIRNARRRVLSKLKKMY